MLFVLHRSVQRVCGTHLRVIAPGHNTAPFEEMLLRWRVVGNYVPDLTARDLNLGPPAPETNAVCFDLSSFLIIDVPHCYALLKITLDYFVYQFVSNVLTFVNRSYFFWPTRLPAQKSIRATRNATAFDKKFMRRALFSSIG